MRGLPLQRRHFLAGLGLAACTRQNGASAPRRPRAAVELYSVYDLPATDARSRELSGIAWDGATRSLWAVQDESALIVRLAPNADFTRWDFAEMVHVTCGGPVDLEGLVMTKDGFIVASEEGPRVIEISRTGQFVREIVLPERFRDARHNQSLESLTLTPSGRWLFTTTEVALPRDGSVATLEAGTRVRIVRIDRETGEIDEYAYATDPAPYATGDWGVSDLAAVGENELLVLERGWTRYRGNTARIHRVTLDASTSCAAIDALSAATPALTKRLFVDLGQLTFRGLPAPKQPQSSPLMDNYEGLAIGPRLEDGRGSVIVVSDDNAHDNQVARILVLAVRT
ncbi:MAG: esterase-like activity of phytase family protein [Labilithrix sp.]|nr:esterase-like activity of phytase family protein [Labilithrix sp.]MCW5816406.1 esterase-like activity of phytase family protein [Labilithrix sp.]